RLSAALVGKWAEQQRPGSAGVCCRAQLSPLQLQEPRCSPNPPLNAPSLKAFIDRMAALPLLYQPGERWVYSVSVDIQGYLVERLLKSSPVEMMRTNVLIAASPSPSPRRRPEGYSRAARRARRPCAAGGPDGGRDLHLSRTGGTSEGTAADRVSAWRSAAGRF